MRVIFLLIMWRNFFIKYLQNLSRNDRQGRQF